VKSQLCLREHSELPGEKVVEVWCRGQLIAAIYGADGPGIRFVSKFDLFASTTSRDPNCIEIQVREEGL